MAGSSFPDNVDWVVAGGNKKTWASVHRTFSHWPFVYPALMGLFVVLGPGLSESVHDFAMYFLLGAMVHIVCDIFNPSGIPLYPPFTGKTRVSLNLFPSNSMISYAVGFAPLVAFGFYWAIF